MKTIRCDLLEMLEAAFTDSQHLDKLKITNEQRDAIVHNAELYNKIVSLIADGVITVVHEEH